MTINKPHLCTRMAVWNPKYSTKYGDYGEEVALLHKRKVDFASPIIIIEFTKARHLAKERFAITRAEAQKHQVGSNGKAGMYVVPMSHFEGWESGSEVRELAIEAFAPGQVGLAV